MYYKINVKVPIIRICIVEINESCLQSVFILDNTCGFHNMMFITEPVLEV